MSASADSVAPEDCLPRQLPEILGDLADRTGDGDSSASITADSSGLQHELCGSFGWLQFFFGRKDKEPTGGYITMRCAPAAVFYAAEALPSNIKDRIIELGFGCLLDLNIDRLDVRVFGSFLMASVKNDDNGPRLVVGNKSLPITPEVVQIVTGLPRGEKQFPDWTYHEIRTARNTFRKLCDDQNMKDMFARSKCLAAYKKLSSYEVSRWVVERMVSLHDQYEEDWIIRCFLILACNSLLFPTTSLFISGKDYIVTESLEEVKDYDWCQRLCDDIVAKFEKFMLERARHVATPHIQGCILFLMDNVECPVTRLVGTPRWKFFTSKIMKSICDLDKTPRPGRQVKYDNLEFRNAAETAYAEIYHKGQDLPRPLFFAQPAVVWSSHQRHLKLGLLRTKKPYFTRGPMSSSASVEEPSSSRRQPTSSNLPFGLVSLQSALSEAISCLDHEPSKVAAMAALKDYDIAVSNVCRSINSNQKKTTRAQAQNSKDQKSIQQA
uniref:Uncharacterized protein n=1 Tax=Zea mays TaxID=4577 RepID=A0A804N1I4_MAIZE